MAGAQTRNGTSLVTNSANTFWNVSPGDSVVDPRITYDPYSGRWIATVCAPYTRPDTLVFVAVSATDDPTGSWFIQTAITDTVVGTNQVLAPDSTTVGFNKDWIVVQAVARRGISNIETHFYVFNKTNLYAGISNPPIRLTNASAATIGGELPAFTYDNSLTNLYIVQNANGTNGTLRLFRINNSNGVPVLSFAHSPLYIQKTNCTWIDQIPGFGNIAPQYGTTNRINAGFDSRIQNVVFRNGFLWCVQTVFLSSPSRTAVQWWQIDPVRTNIVQTGRIDDPLGTNFYAYPSIAVNQFNDVMIGYASFSSTQYASASYAFRAFYDPVNSFRAGYRFKAGKGIYGVDERADRNRWGDYSATCVDPVNDTDLWTLQEYAETENFWGTWWAKVSVPMPTNDAFASP